MGDWLEKHWIVFTGIIIIIAALFVGVVRLIIHLISLLPYTIFCWVFPFICIGLLVCAAITAIKDGFFDI